MYEYYEAVFNYSDSVYGCSFHMLTGLHGCHVIVGACFLLVCFIRLLKRAYSISNTEDLLVLHIKEILDTLLEKNSTEYLKTSRVATRSTLRSTTYIYFVLFINKNSE